MIYINMKTSEGVETVDEVDTRKEARAMLAEYQLMSGNYYLSIRCTKEWRES